MHANDHPRPMPDEWRTHALCRNHPDLPWIAELKNRGDLDKVVATYSPICRTCPVRSDCEQAGRNTPNEDSGIYAGLPSSVLRSGGSIYPLDDDTHGTLTGYRKHFRHNTPMCGPCRDAKRRDDTARRAAARQERTA